MSKLKRKYYNDAVTAFMEGWIMAKKHSGELLKDVKSCDLDQQYLNILRITGHKTLYPTVEKSDTKTEQ